MSSKHTIRRRWFGALVLIAALLMLIGGETLAKGRVVLEMFVMYWLVCFALTMLAIVIAFLDVRNRRRETRQEQRHLLETTLKEIESDAKTKPRWTNPFQQ